MYNSKIISGHRFEKICKLIFSIDAFSLCWDHSNSMAILNVLNLIIPFKDEYLSYDYL